MKKIILALSVTVLALSATFADVSLEYTQKADILGDNGKLKYTGYAKNKGTLKTVIKNDGAGVQLEVEPTIAKGAEATKTIEFSHYFGWVNFGEGAFQLQSGVWETRSVNRMNKDAGKWEGSQYERYKYGVMGGSSGKDVNNISTVNGTKALASQLKYNAGDFYIEGLLVESAYDANSGLNPKSGWAAEAGLNLGEGNKLTVDFKNSKKDDYAIAAFFENKTFKEDLDFVVGATIGRPASKKIEYGIDARARYTLSDNMVLTTMNNLSYLGSSQKYRIWDMVSVAVTASDNLKVLMTVEWEHQDLLNVDGKTDNAVGKLDFIPSATYTVGKGVDMSAGLIIATEGWSKPTTATVNVPFILKVAL